MKSTDELDLLVKGCSDPQTKAQALAYLKQKHKR
jgi:hypothetical protein